MGHLDEVTRDNRNRRHALGLYYQQQNPAIQKRHRWMKCFAQVRVLATDVRAPNGKLGPMKAAMRASRLNPHAPKIRKVCVPAGHNRLMRYRSR
jgi:hypothetical protein